MLYAKHLIAIDLMYWRFIYQHYRHATTAAMHAGHASKTTSPLRARPYRGYALPVLAS
jgi:hypothetical protein